MDMSADAIKVYKILTGKNFSDTEAIDIIRYMDSAQKEGLATSEDMTELRSDLKQDMTELRSDLKQDMTELRSDLKKDISRLDLKISDVRSELIKWTGGMLVAQAGVIVALIKLL